MHGIFKDAALLTLLERIIRSHEVTLGRGLPIGNLTSQHLAKLYLGGLDRFIDQEARHDLGPFDCWAPHHRVARPAAGDSDAEQKVVWFAFWRSG